MGQAESGGPSLPANLRGGRQAGPAEGNAVSDFFSNMRSFGSYGKQLEDVCSMDRGARPLGKGSFATVWRGRLKSDGRTVAIKVMDKAKLRHMNVPPHVVQSEVTLTKECAGHDMFIQMFDFVETSQKYFIVLEFCDGGCLQDAAQEGDGVLGEDKVRVLMRQMINAIEFLHSRNVCHRDIKPHNFLVVGRLTSDTAKVKLSDFGVAVRFQPGKLMTEQIGTPAFMAPEIHLLPRKSRGYDQKVDMWAIGVVMVFLLANEYPFVDGAGRLLRHQLVRGDLPLWDSDVFSSLFQGFGEAAGLRRRRPSRLARDLVQRLVLPNRERRLSASGALRHAWITGTGQDIREADLELDNAPLFKWEEFEESLSLLDKNFEWIRNAVGSIDVAPFEVPPSIDPSDDRFKNCVVCYGTAGHLSYRCSQCQYTVCLQCLERLPRPVCPHCRHVPEDMALAQLLAKVQAHASRHAGKLKENFDAIDWDVPLPNVDMRVHAPISEEEAKRQSTCRRCSEPTSATSYACPCCGACVCYQCAKRLAGCPSCGDVEHNEQALKEYLAAGVALSSAVGFGSEVVSRVSTRLQTAMSEVSDATGSVLTSFAQNLESSGFGASGTGRATSAELFDQLHLDAAGAHAHRSSSISGQADNCHMCNAVTSLLDHVCPCCNAAVCKMCIRTPRLCQEPKCPRCGDANSNARAMRFAQKSAQACEAGSAFWEGLVGMGAELFGDTTRPNSSQTVNPTHATPS